MTLAEYAYYSAHKKNDDIAQWNHTANMLFQIYYSAPRKGKKLSIEDFHPYSEKNMKKGTPGDVMDAMKILEEARKSGRKPPKKKS